MVVLKSRFWIYIFLLTFAGGNMALINRRFLLVLALFFCGINGFGLDQTKEYRIGETGPGGGIVFYKNLAGFSVDDGNGNSEICHYLEVSKDDLGCVTWMPGSVKSKDMTCFYGLGEGKIATAKIIEKYSGEKLTVENSAALLCTKYKTSTTKSGDWFLPTSDELRLLFKNLTVEKLNITNTEFYWSSSLESDSVWVRKNKTSAIESKDKKLMVRAVRAF